MDDSDRPRDGLALFLERASAAAGISPPELCELLKISSKTIETNSAKDLKDLIDPDSVLLVEQGVVTQYCWLESGERQIVGYFMPGDIANLPQAFADLAMMQFHAHADTRLFVLNRQDILQAADRRSGLFKALLQEIAIEARRAQDLITNIAARRAAARIAHFCLDYAARSNGNQISHENYYIWPFTQQDISEMLGLSLVHTNKSYRSLQKADLLTLDRRRLVIKDRDGLRRCSCGEGDHRHGISGHLGDLNIAAGDIRVT